MLFDATDSVWGADRGFEREMEMLAGGRDEGREKMEEEIQIVRAGLAPLKDGAVGERGEGVREGGREGESEERKGLR